MLLPTAKSMALFAGQPIGLDVAYVSSEDPDSAVSDASTVVSSGSIGWKSAPGAGAGRIELALEHPSPISAIIVQTRRVGFLAMHACVRGYGGRNINHACPLRSFFARPY